VLPISSVIDCAIFISSSGTTFRAERRAASRAGGYRSSRGRVIDWFAKKRLEEHGRIATGREVKAQAKALTVLAELGCRKRGAYRAPRASKPNAAGFCHPLVDPKALEERPLARARSTGRCQLPRPKDRAGGADLKTRSAFIFADDVLDEKGPTTRADLCDLSALDAVERRRPLGEARSGLAPSRP
jgi:hypothetical protein